MERRTDLIIAERIMGKNFIGPEQLESIKDKLGIKSPFQLGLEIPHIPFNKAVLEKYYSNYILILGIQEAYDNMPLTINKLRETFGFNPEVKEPCFYNQDWYLNEFFAESRVLKYNWFLVKKTVYEESRGKVPNEIVKTFNDKQKLPSAILACFTFFTNYFLNNEEILWKKDFIWCEDTDHNGDQIYVGRYQEPTSINKKGFNIHRFLTIQDYYGYIEEIIR